MSTYLSDVAAAGAAGSTTNVYSVLGQYGSLTEVCDGGVY